MICPLCKSKNTRLFHDKVWSVKKGKVYRCQNCDITFLFPVLDSKARDKFYKNYNEHLKLRGVTAQADPREFHKKSKKIAQERYAIIKKYFTKVKNILEIGSATGAFLSLLKGKQCYGVEPADTNREFSKQFITEAYVDISEIPINKRFDIICLFHVFEHIENPLEFLEKCKKHLAKDGIVLLEVPYIEDPLITLYDCKAFKDFYFQPMHNYIYSLKSLDFVFTKAGYFRKEVIFYQRYGLDNHLAWLSKGKPDGDTYFNSLFRNNFEYKKTLKNINKTDTLFYAVRLK